MYEVAIIGAASTGASAGLFTAKAGKKTLLIDNDKSGTTPHTIVSAGDGARVAINLISELNGKRYIGHDVLK